MFLLSGYISCERGSCGSEMHVMYLLCWESTVQPHCGIIVSKCSLLYHGIQDSAIATVMHQLSADLAPA